MARQALAVAILIWSVFRLVLPNVPGESSLYQLVWRHIYEESTGAVDQWLITLWTGCLVIGQELQKLSILH